MTKALWAERDYVVPSPIPHLVLSQTPRGILVQYDAECERTGDIHHRAYYLQSNLSRIAKGQKPLFVDPAKEGPERVIPILNSSEPGPHRAEFFAVCLTNGSTFTLYRGAKILGPCDLPVYKDGGETAKQVALTPLAVVGDASIVGALTAPIWASWFAVGAAANPDGTPANFY